MMNVTAVVLLVLLSVNVGSGKGIGKCKELQQFYSVNVTDFASIHPIGLQQCEKHCLSLVYCQVLAFHAKTLTCYIPFDPSVNETVHPTWDDGFVVRHRTDILHDTSDDTVSITDQNSGEICVMLSSVKQACVGVGVCGDPPVVPHSISNRGDRTLLPGSVISYSCIEGFFILKEDAAGQVVCQPTLQWKHQKILCVKLHYVYLPKSGIMVRGFGYTETHKEAVSTCATDNTSLVKVNTTQKLNEIIGLGLQTNFHIDGHFSQGNWAFSDDSAVDHDLFAEDKSKLPGLHLILGADGIFPNDQDTAKALCEFV